YLAGPALARGYVGAPGLTAERFVANVCGSGRMYRTGDLVRWSVSHELEFVGRVDDQVKVRGFRVELGEIDAVLGSFGGVDAAVTVVRGDVLASYVVGARLEGEVLREFVSGRLPRYMVPASVTVLGELPLTRSGKVDRGALPEPVLPSVRSPRGSLEELVAGVVAEVLGVGEVDAETDFFALGGTSLTAARLASRLAHALNRNVGVRDVLEGPTVAQLATRLSTAQTRAVSVPRLIVRHPGEAHRPAPLAPAQERLWLLDRMNPRSPDYLLTFALDLDGDVDLAALAAAISDVLGRHEPLRTVFPDVDGVPVQTATVVNLDLAPADDDVDAALSQLTSVGFDLTSEAPIRVRILRRPAGGFTVAAAVHHIAMDGLSFGPLARDLTTAYVSRAGGRAPTWDALPIRYADYARWHRKVVDDNATEDLEFWTTQLHGLPELLPLPTDHPRTSAERTAGRVTFAVDRELNAAVKEVARKYAATPFMVLHSALVAMLSVVAGVDDIAVGTPTSGRIDPGLDDLVGMFVGTVVLRTRIDPKMSFAQLVSSVRSTNLAAMAHGDQPFERVVDAVAPRRSADHHPLFQVMFAYQGFAEPDLVSDHLTVTPRAVQSTVSRYDLEVELLDTRRGGAMNGVITYPTELFEQDTVLRWSHLLVRLLRAAVTDPSLQVGDLPLMSDAERDELAPMAGMPGVSPVMLPNLLKCVDPDVVAVRYVDDELTYEQLDARANRLARRLIGLGMGPDDRVAVILPRSLESVVAFWAVARSGATVVPIDVGHPTSRIAEILTRAHVKAAIARSDDMVPAEIAWVDAGDADGNSAAVCDWDRVRPLMPDHAAYVVFTSGSTGTPKGVVVTHRGLGNHAAEVRALYEVDARSRVLHFAAPSFDGAIHEILVAAIGGATLIVAPADLFGGDRLKDLLRRERVTHWTTTPSVPAVMDPSGLDELVFIAVVGEACPPEVPARWSVGRTLVDLYGPTEHTVWATGSQGLGPGDPITIGRPIRGASVVVLDGRLRPVPVGVVGELYLAGPALARGYVGAPGLTAERFVANVCGSGRMYRTGDLV
ncbi:MAG: amino acid adenylation domain-containing protein, partial [Rhodococcus sp. (in: high G+C Gram-positive bacteria)]